MIYIWDNGESHSDREIAFIDGSALPVETVKRFLEADRGWMQGKVLGITEQVKWLGDKATDTLAEWECPGYFLVDPHGHYLYGDAPPSHAVTSPLWDHTSPEILAVLADAWAKKSPYRPWDKAGQRALAWFLTEAQRRLTAAKV